MKANPWEQIKSNKKMEANQKVQTSCDFLIPLFQTDLQKQMCMSLRKRIKGVFIILCKPMK